MVLFKLINDVGICFWFYVALNDALMKEVERLKIATGEAMNPSESYNLGMHPMQFTESNFFSMPQQHSGPSGHLNIQYPQFSHSPSNMPTHQLQQTNSRQMSEMWQNDHLGSFKGLDISSKGSALVKSEGPSISASESSTTFWI